MQGSDESWTTQVAAVPRSSTSHALRLNLTSCYISSFASQPRLTAALDELFASTRHPPPISSKKKASSCFLFRCNHLLCFANSEVRATPFTTSARPALNTPGGLSAKLLRLPPLEPPICARLVAAALYEAALLRLLAVCDISTLKKWHCQRGS